MTSTSTWDHSVVCVDEHAMNAMRSTRFVPVAQEIDFVSGHKAGLTQRASDRPRDRRDGSGWGRRAGSTCNYARRPTSGCPWCGVRASETSRPTAPDGPRRWAPTGAPACGPPSPIHVRLSGCSAGLSAPRGRKVRGSTADSTGRRGAGPPGSSGDLRPDVSSRLSFTIMAPRATVIGVARLLRRWWPPTGGYEDSKGRGYGDRCADQSPMRYSSSGSA